jgi:hypothetical protein
MGLLLLKKNYLDYFIPARYTHPPVHRSRTNEKNPVYARTRNSIIDNNHHQRRESRGGGEGRKGGGNICLVRCFINKHMSEQLTF